MRVAFAFGPTVSSSTLRYSCFGTTRKSNDTRVCGVEFGSV
jgi:hypothetical protein